MEFSEYAKSNGIDRRSKEEYEKAREVLDRARNYSSKNVPSKTELQAILKNNIILYTKTDSGFVPVWKAD